MEKLLNFILSNYNYAICVLIMLTGFFTVASSYNLIKKLMGLAIFQTSVLILYISSGYLEGGYVPILDGKSNIFVNPLPQVLMLTAIVVGVATTALGLAIVVRIKEEYGTIEDDEILDCDNETFKKVRASHVSLKYNK